MSIINATEDTLASILLIRKDLEEYPEPYRSNGDIEIRVSFEAYQRFIDKYLAVGDFLATQTNTLLYYLRNDRLDLLCRCFYLDMALAVVKEVWYTDITANPTKLTHIVADSYRFNEDYVTGMCDIFTKDLSRAQNQLVARMRKLQYAVPPTKVNKFSGEFKYAALLYAMADMTGEFSNISFSRWSYERSCVHDDFGDKK